MIYRAVARKHGVTVEEVEGEIEKAVKYAYFNGDRFDVFKDGVPSNEEFIWWVAGKVSDDLACETAGR
jgi:hypothetical protein